MSGSMNAGEALIQPDRGQDAVTIHLTDKTGFESFAKGLKASQRAALAAQKFDGSGYQTAIVPDGDSWFAVGGVADPQSLSSWCLAKLAEVLPAGTYRLSKDASGGDPGPALHGWQTAQYVFDRYKKPEKPVGPRVLLTDKPARIDVARREAEAVCLVRDLVNTPAEDMGPAASCWPSRRRRRNTAPRSRRCAATRSKPATRWSTRSDARRRGAMPRA